MTARQWTSAQERTAAQVCHDDVALFVRSGFVSGADAHRDPEGERQWRVAADVCAAAARTYHETGIDCAIDTFLLPHLRPVWTRIEDLDPRVVVLLPDVEVTVDRNARRPGWGSPEEGVRANHVAMRAWLDVPGVLVLDTSAMSVTEVVGEMARRLHRLGACR